MRNLATLITLAFVLVISSALGQDTAGEEVARKVAPAVVMVHGTAIGGGAAFGSGFLVSSDGKIVTSLHVIRGLKSGNVQLPNGDLFDSFLVLAVDERRDLAVVKIPGFDLPSVELGNSNEVQQGETVFLVGNPAGLRGTITSGLVSAIRDLNQGFRLIQTDAAANPGNSGGPLVNSRGQAVGVLGFKLRGSENLNFAVPINYVRGLIDNPQTPLTLDRLPSAIDSVTSSEPAVPATTYQPAFPLTVRIKHRHAWSGYRHATLALYRDRIEFRELKDKSHDFNISSDKVVQFNSSYASLKGNASYTIQFSEATKAGRQISFEIDHGTLNELVSYLKMYCRNVLIH